MKKIVTIFAFVLVYISTQAQKGSPIQPYNENGYTMAEVKTFALGDDSLALQWRENIVRIVNKGLADCGENLVVDQSHVTWIIEQCKYETVTLQNFTNSRKFDNKMDFFHDENFTGIAGVFYYGKCRLVLFKQICINLLEVPVAKAPPVNPSTTTSTTITPAGTPINISIYNNNVNTNNNSNTNEVFVTPVEGTSYSGDDFMALRSGGRYYNQPHQPQVRFRVNYQQSRRAYHPPVQRRPVIQPRTMPPGIPDRDDSRPPGGGIDADRRRMPPGIGG